MTPSRHAAIRSASTRRPHRHRRVAWLVALTVALLSLLAACSEESQAQLRERAENVDTEALQEQAEQAQQSSDEQAQESSDEQAPAAEETPTEQPESEGLSNEEITTIIILGIAAIALVLIATSLASNHSDKKRADQASLNSRLDSIVGGARWAHDSGSLEVLTQTDPQQLVNSWTSVRERIVDVESEIAVLENSTGSDALGQDLHYLGQAVAGLRGSLQAYVNLQTGSGTAPQPEMVQSAGQTVYERRRQLQAAIDPITAARR